MKLIQKFLPPVIYIVTVVFILVMFSQYNSEQSKQGGSTDIGLYTSYVLMIAAVLGIVAGFLLNAITNPVSIVRTFIGFGVMLVIWFISYGMANNEVTEVYKKFNVGESLSKIIGGILILTYSLGLLAILGIILSEVRSALRV